MSHIHPTALIEPNVNIGYGTKIWAFVHILSGATIGEDCNICDNCFVESDVTIGNRVTIKSGAYLWDGIALEDDVFVGPCVAFTNDIFPRSKQYLTKPVPTLVKKGASLGANSTIVAGIVIGEYAMIGAGSVVTRDIPSHALFYGNPAKFHGWVCCCSIKLSFSGPITICKCGSQYELKESVITKKG